jgi:putative ABC transport system permease protein
MIRNYIKIAYRNLLKGKFISFINLFGLTVGLTSCFLILGYILNEISYDKYNTNSKNIYRVERTFLNAETKAVSLQLGTVAPPFAPLLQNDFKQIKKITRLLPNGNTAFKYEEKKFNEKDAYFADEYFFDVFDVKVTKGNPAKALNDPLSVMLTPAIAEKYFGKEEPLNKVIRLDNQMDCKVTGIFEPFPTHSHFHPAILISFNTLKDTAVYGEEQLRTNWGNNSFLTYMLLPEGYDPGKLEAQFPAFQNRHMGAESDGKVKVSDWSKLSLRPLNDIHLYSHTDLEAEENGDIKRIYIFSAIALFILLIACINYMNLSTARSVIRAKEIGIRKVVGALRKELIFQFLSESVLLSIIAVLLALGLSWILMPWLSKLSGQDLSFGIFLKWQVIMGIMLVPFVVGIAAGIYPAMFLSSFKPVSVLKGIFKAGGSSISFRKVLVVAQFAISIVLIIATSVVIRQLRYMQNKSLGFDRDHIVTMPYNSGLNNSYEAFKNDLAAEPAIKSVGRSSRIPTGRLLDAMGSQMNRGDSFAPTKADIKFIVADEYFFPTYGVKIAAGRNFSKDFGMDTSAFLINEAAVKVLGLRSNEEAIGKKFRYGNRTGELVGVFNDFHFESMHERILPLVAFMPARSGYSRLSVKVAGNNMPGALAQMEKTWKKFLPEVPFEYTFMDESFENLYRSEERQKTIFTVFACIAIFIACLGLFGLSAFAITQRIKEIGIRKVLGASLGSIVQLLSTDFLKLVAIAAVIAFPVAWYAMHKWLEDFAYRSSVPWWIFVIAGLLAAAIALFTISFQAIKAALTNPVKNLRTE